MGIPPLVIMVQIFSATSLWARSTKIVFEMKAQFDMSSLIFTFPSLLRHLAFTVPSNNDVRIEFVKRDVESPKPDSWLSLPWLELHG